MKTDYLQGLLPWISTLVVWRVSRRVLHRVCLAMIQNYDHITDPYRSPIVGAHDIRESCCNFEKAILRKKMTKTCFLCYFMGWWLTVAALLHYIYIWLLHYFVIFSCGDEAVQDVLSQRSARDGSTKTSGRFWCCRAMGWYCPMVVTGPCWFAQDHLEASSRWSMLWHTNGHRDSFTMYKACSFLESAHAVRNPRGTRGRAFALFSVSVSVSWRLQGSSWRISDISWIFMMSWYF